MSTELSTMSLARRTLLVASLCRRGGANVVVAHAHGGRALVRCDRKPSLQLLAAFKLTSPQVAVAATNLVGVQIEWPERPAAARRKAPKGRRS